MKPNARSGKKPVVRGRGQQERRREKAVAADVRKVEMAEEVFARHRSGASYRAIAAAVGLSPARCHEIVKEILGRSVHQLSLAKEEHRAMQLERTEAAPSGPSWLLRSSAARRVAAPVRPLSLTRRSSRRVRARAAAA